jgi:tRNA threonylcarbamoyladenosine biosynthesis protein TsaE
VTKLIAVTKNADETVALGQKIGQQLQGGEVIELISDLGGGKTQLVRGLAAGMGSTDQVQSPTFTISRIYKSKALELHHFDFYRLGDPGIVGLELAEVMQDSRAIVAIEWADTVKDILPKKRLQIVITASSDTNRQFLCEFPVELNYLFAQVETA